MKSITTSIKSLCVVLMLASVTSLSAQTISLSPMPGLDVNAGPCEEITAGTTLFFDRNADCDQDILITRIDVTPPVEVLQTSAATTQFTFPDEGKYVVFCGAPNSPSNVAVQAICVNAAAGTAAIPTLGEWGLIFLLLISLIIGVTVLRKAPSTSKKATT